MTPNIGQGANTAIEDAAALASLVNGLICNKSNSGVIGNHVESMLREYQEVRYPRAKSTCQRSTFGTRFHTRDTLAKALVGRYVFPYADPLVERAVVKAVAGGGLVDFLPRPKRSGVELSSAKPTGKGATQLQWKLFWVSSLFLCWSLYWIRPHIAHKVLAW